MDEEEELYDEFGNYIGPDVDDHSSVSSEASSLHSEQDQQPLPQPQPAAPPRDSTALIVPGAGGPDSQSIVLYHDKSYYPDASDVYGPDAETRVELEDTQALETPIIAPVKKKVFELVEPADKPLPQTTFEWNFLAGLMDHSIMIRNIAILGHLHHGKTSFCDMLIKQTHKWHNSKSKKEKHLRYLDVRLDEQIRGLSIKCRPISLVLPALSGKSFLFNIVDTPGHPNFVDEQVASVRLVDGVVLVVDVIEAVMRHTERDIELAVRDDVPIVLVLNKIDRLITEVKLPPEDAYLKLRYCINEVNAHLRKLVSDPELYEKLKLSPLKGNVVFASSKHEWSFTLESFVNQRYGETFSRKELQSMVKRLWGDFYYDRRTGSFTKFREQVSSQMDDDNNTSSSGLRSFVEFILQPLYKIYSHVLGLEERELSYFLHDIKVALSKQELHSNPHDLLRIVLSRFFVDSSGFVEAVSRSIPAPCDSAAAFSRIPRIWTGDLKSSLGQQLLAGGDRGGKLIVHVSKLIPRPDCSAIDTFGRIWNGTLRRGDRVKVLREGFVPEDPEDMSLKEVGRIWILQGRYRIEVSQACAGNLVLIEGIDDAISKTATLTSSSENGEVDPEEDRIFAELKYFNAPTMRVAIEPLIPSELPKVLDGLRKVSQTYPNCLSKVEDSGEHVLIGTGEMYLDSALHDLRTMFAEVELKVSDPVACFAETVIDTSAIKCFAETPNGKNKITMIAEPMEETTVKGISAGRLHSGLSKKELSHRLRKEFGWDALASRSLWAFGPDIIGGSNVLLNDTLTPSVDEDDSDSNRAELLESVKGSIVQGFQWAVREGPLCDEPIRNVKFKLLDATIAESAIHRGAGQIIPTSRRAAYSAFLMASPRLLEPIYFTEIITPIDCVPAINKVLSRRRGRILQETPKPGTPLYVLYGEIPLIESFGFETDLRTHTQGQAFCLSVFNHWEVVPGDPLDKSIVLKPLEPSPAPALAREFMIKTRRRKGLSEDVSVAKFFDDPALMDLARNDSM